MDAPPLINQAEKTHPIYRSYKPIRTFTEKST